MNIAKLGVISLLLFGTVLNPEIMSQESYIENVEVVEMDVPTVKQPEYISLGEFLVSAYCSCEVCCNEHALNRPLDENGNEIVKGSIGQVLTPQYSIAVDPKVIPYGTEVMFGGNTYLAQDCGGAIKENRIDLYFNDHQDALEWGMQYYEVFVLESEE